MAVKVLTLSEARESLGDAVNAVAYGQNRVVIQRHGRSVAALVSIEDLDLIRRFENDMLGEEAIRRLDDPKDRIVSHEEAMKELGIDQARRSTKSRRGAGRRAGQEV